MLLYLVAAKLHLGTGHVHNRATDYWSYANRLWTVGSGNVTVHTEHVDSEVLPVGSTTCTDSTATNYDPTQCNYRRWYLVFIHQLHLH